MGNSDLKTKVKLVGLAAQAKDPNAIALLPGDLSVHRAMPADGRAA